MLVQTQPQTILIKAKYMNLINPIQPLPWMYKEREEFVGDGIYCFYPFDSPLDKYGKGVFKIGMTLDINDRTYGYHTYFPEGVFIFAVLRTPLIGRNEYATDKAGLRRYITAVEKFIFKEVVDNGGHRVTMDVRKDGKTEWFYTDEDTIDNAFKKAHKKFGGKIKLTTLKTVIPKKNPYFQGTINFY